MISRQFRKGDAESSALYSDCERYRFALTRVWNTSQQRVLYIMLNPSTATELKNDPTIERCERRSRRLGFGGMQIVNIFAFRATDPRDLKAFEMPVGTGNDAVIRFGVEWADVVIAAWGAHGDHLGRGGEVAALLRDTGVEARHFGLSKAGHPRHPLYIGYAQQPMAWDAVDLGRLADAGKA